MRSVQVAPLRHGAASHSFTSTVNNTTSSKRHSVDTPHEVKRSFASCSYLFIVSHSRLLLYSKCTAFVKDHRPNSANTVNNEVLSFICGSARELSKQLGRGSMFAAPCPSPAPQLYPVTYHGSLINSCNLHRPTPENW